MGWKRWKRFSTLRQEKRIRYTEAVKRTERRARKMQRGDEPVAQTVFKLTENGKEWVFDFDAFSRCFRNEEKRRSREKEKAGERSRGVQGELIRDIAEATNCSEETVKGWKTGKHGPSELKMVETMASVLQIEPEYLLKEKRAMAKRVIGDAERAAVYKIYTMMYDIANLCYSFRSDGHGTESARKLYYHLRDSHNSDVYDNCCRLQNEFRYEVEKQTFYLSRELRGEIIDLFNSLPLVNDWFVRAVDESPDYLNFLDIDDPGWLDEYPEDWEEKYFEKYDLYYCDYAENKDPSKFYKRLNEVFADYIYSGLRMKAGALIGISP